MRYDNVGKIVVNRVTGRERLVGEEFDANSFVSITLYGGNVVKDGVLGRDEIFNNLSDRIVELELSPRQWGEFVSSFGVGVGTTCTIRSATGRNIKNKYVTPNSVERSEHTINHVLNEKLKDFSEKQEVIKEILEKKSIGKADREKLGALYADFDNFLSSTIPYIKQNLREEANDVLNNAETQFKHDLNLITDQYGKESLGQKVKDWDVRNAALKHGSSEVGNVWE
ncbi:MAG: hypothetical protein ABF991_00150 [Liquorilactobacillus hordei]|uniref:hypothetical protein n=1 Tax=Liquorilactobacillus hordei TaxID=468911 RepID=UPI0039ED5307